MYRTPELSSRSFTAFAWCDFIHIILSRGQNGRVLVLGKWSRINHSASAKRIGLPPCHIGIAAAFIQKHQVICLESRHKTVPVFSHLCHIGDASVHWREETSSCGDNPAR